MKKTLPLILIFVLAFLLRVFKLDTIPPALNRDEAGFGYEAYSLLKTARDQHGRFLPLGFENFGVWEYPFQFYLKIPFIALLGLSTFSVRFSVVSVSLVGIFFFYKLATKWLGPKLALLSTFLLSISSWHFFMSRAGYSQSFYGLAFLLMGTYYLLFGRSKTSQVIGSIILGLTSFAYPAYFFFLPAYLILISFFYHRKLLIISALILLSAYITFWVPNLKRIPGGMFYSGIEENLRFNWSDKPVGESLALGYKYDLLERLLHHPRLSLPYKAVLNYFDAFSVDFWLKKGRGFESNVEGFGNLLVYEPLLIIIGLGYLFWTKQKYAPFFLAWLLISPIASMFTQEPASTKLIHMLIPLIIFEAAGVYFLVKQFKLPLIILIILPVIFFNLLYYDAYFRHLPANAGRWWQAGFLDVAQLTQQYPDQNIYWNAKADFGYIYILFSTSYNPAAFQRLARRQSGPYNLNLVTGFDRYNFPDDIDWTKTCGQPSGLYIDRMDSLSTAESQYPFDGKISHPGGYTFVYALVSPDHCYEVN
jgi:4-amino-4-deoxy-L-arabinose transferase-like glycosyltransferase